MIDDQRLYEEVRDYVQAFNPELADRVEYYDSDKEGLSLFERFHVHEQVHKALDRKVWLPSGGSLIIESTEALTVIDVNTGKNVGKSNLEETVFHNNMEAAEEIAKQLRLRDIGGIIVIDFIDMEIQKNQDQVLLKFREQLAKDKTRTQVFEVSHLGLVEMTRKRTRESLQHVLCEDCPACTGRGFVMTAETVCFEIFREIIRQSRQFEFDEVMVLANQDVIELLLDEQAASLAELEEQTGKSIRLQTESLYMQDQFDVVLM